MTRDLAASVRQRLLDRSRSEGRLFQELLQYYAMERFLFRLANSPHAERFILKGALLLTAWQAPQSRSTVDIDLEGRLNNDPETVTNVIREVCRIESVPDGIHFDPGSLEIRRIKEDAEYEGLRARFDGKLAQAKIRMQIDIGFGDVITPKPSKLEYPTILVFPPPVLLAYPRETVVAEKLEALTALGILNSRMKDYFDIWLLSQLYRFEGPLLAEAITATFRNRSTSLAKDPAKTKQWAAFRALHRSTALPDQLEDIVPPIANFCRPVLLAIGNQVPFRQTWNPGGALGKNSSLGKLALYRHTRTLPAQLFLVYDCPPYGFGIAGFHPACRLSTIVSEICGGTPPRRRQRTGQRY
jgi:hypothetical protein